jgi:hypothetical protein
MVEHACALRGGHKGAMEGLLSISDSVWSHGASEPLTPRGVRNSWPR